MNKRILLFFVLFLNASLIFAQDLNGVKVLINPGHGGLDPANDRNIPTTGFWESVGNLSKGLYLREILQKLGATVVMSRTTNYDADDLPLSSIVAMANNNNVQYMHSIHSNAAGGNYTLMLYQGTNSTPTYPDSKVMSQYIGNEIYSAHRTTDLRLAGDFDFYGTGRAYLGVFKGLTMPGSLSEGSFHDYIPESWRLRNEAYLKHEAWAIAKAFLSFWGRPPLSTGIAAGIVRDVDKASVYSIINASDAKKPVNNIKVTLRANDASNAMTPRVYTGDNYNNGFFMFDEVTPGSYTLVYEAVGYFKDSSTVNVLAGKNNFADKYLVSNSQAEVSSVTFSPASVDSIYPGNQSIVIDFTRAMNTASVEAAISTTPSAPLTFSWTNDAEVKISTSGLPFGTAMTLTIAGTAKGQIEGIFLDGNKDGVGGDSYSFSFKTRSKDVWAPVIESLYPSDKLENVELIPLINLSFNELLNTGTLSGKVQLVKAAGNVPIGVTTKYYPLTNGKAVVSLFPSSALLPNETYNVIVSAGLSDQYGNGVPSNIVYTFKTGSESATITSIDNFELDLLTNWAGPNATSPSGIIASETSIAKNLSITNRFSGSRVSMQLNYSWDKNASSWFIREYLSTGTPKNVTFTSQNILQSYVFGDGSNNKFRFCVADGADFSGLEVSPWYTIDWAGWKLVSWDMGKDGVGVWDGNTKGNGALDGQLKFDSFQFTYTPGSPTSGLLFFDDLRTAVKPYVGVEKENGAVKPSSYSLEQNYPNPFNPSTTLSYQLPENSFVSLKVFDLLGREVATLVNQEQASGKYRVEFNAGNIPSGIYIYMLNAGNYKETKKMMLLK
ncbi:MAG: T9SS type A sorting domain-containing protein [Ignavibacteria bacterium]|jgi:N-acetylmuramoyl-L-alanine amidase|nr:T9SS type A sorting domain-containing protein [Ignavibacteria bacterium]MCU7522555.1 T9SS type A sorting domain-containing protein [Ignavibacteria bacterium]MCU7526130.1 T9SS type A sorting domain-containing protein [Ignavibacteria bacterium]